MMAAASEKVRSSLLRQLAGPMRMGEMDEFAFLVSHILQNNYINGEVIRLDGGIRMSNL